MKRKVFHTVMLIVAIAYFGFAARYYLSKASDVDRLDWAFLIFISLNVLFVLTLILYSQYLSISLVNKASKRWKEKLCKYCGNSKSKLVCSACDSIQWNTKKGEVLTSVAIFLAHHRWKVINGIMTIFLLAPVLYAGKFHYDSVHRLNEKKFRVNQEIKQIIRLSNEIRPVLYDVSTQIKNRQITSTDLKVLRTKLSHQYFEYAWELAEVVDYIEHQDTSQYLVKAQKKGVELLTFPKVIPILDTLFFEMLHFIAIYISDSNPQNCQIMQESVNRVNRFTKAISCSIGEISFNPSIVYKNEFEKIDGCLEDIENQLVLLKKEYIIDSLQGQ